MSAPRYSALEMIALLRDTLDADAALLAWSVLHYGRRHTVYIDLDGDNPPPSDDYPFVAITELSIEDGLVANARNFEIGLGCALLAREIDSTDSVRAYRGLLRVAEMSDLVCAALLGALRQAFPTSKAGASSGLSGEYPLYASYITLTADEIKSSRAPRYT